MIWFYVVPKSRLYDPSRSSPPDLTWIEVLKRSREIVANATLGPKLTTRGSVGFAFGIQGESWDKIEEIVREEVERHDYILFSNGHIWDERFINREEKLTTYWRDYQQCRGEQELSSATMQGTPGRPEAEVDLAIAALVGELSRHFQSHARLDAKPIDEQLQKIARGFESLEASVGGSSSCAGLGAARAAETPNQRCLRELLDAWKPVLSQSIAGGLQILVDVGLVEVSPEALEALKALR